MTRPSTRARSVSRARRGLILAAASLAFASSAFGQMQSGAPDVQGFNVTPTACLCGVPAAGSAPDGMCFEDQSCSTAAGCNADGDCESPGFCLLDGTNSFCTNTMRCTAGLLGAVCMVNSDCDIIVDDGVCTAFAGTCAVQVPGCDIACQTPGPLTFPDCPLAVPSLGQWGLIALALAMIVGAALVLRRGLPPRAAANIVLLLALGVGLAGLGYASIQAERSCRGDVATVELLEPSLRG